MLFHLLGLSKNQDQGANPADLDVDVDDLETMDAKTLKTGFEPLLDADAKPETRAAPPRTSDADETLSPLALAWREEGRAVADPVTGTRTRAWGAPASELDGSRPVVLLLHGAFSSSYSFRKLLPALASRGLAPVAVDLPGFGFGPRGVPDEELALDRVAGWVMRVASAAGVAPSVRVHVLGQDVSAAIAWEMVRAFGDRVASMTLASAHLEARKPKSPRRRATSPKAAARCESWATWLLGLGLGPRMCATIMREVCALDAPTDEELRVYGELALREDGGKTFVAMCRVLHDAGWAAPSAPPSVPVQLVWGEDDKLMPYKKHADEAKRALGVSCVRLVRGRHLVQEDSPADVADAVQDMVARVGV